MFLLVLDTNYNSVKLVIHGDCKLVFCGSGCWFTFVEDAKYWPTLVSEGECWTSPGGERGGWPTLVGL